ncbi:MAG TPA: hypothetical protein VEZ15_04880 [Acidimicrobiia bacterium]|nr:hypothetical protein [Acidimicrobiia bacterium]
MAEAVVWCPSCGAEYRVGSTTCAECRVALVDERPEHLDDLEELDDEDAGGLVELGDWPKLQAQVLRRRLETAGVPVMIEWTGVADDRRGVLLVPEDQRAFGAAVVNEIDVDDEVSDDSPHAYVARIEEHLSAAAGLLDELRTRLDALEADGRI